jgi:hypothetical protein
MNANSIIAAAPPNDGREWGCQCARCGASCGHERCGCNGSDPQCEECSGHGGWWGCLARPEWCLAHPINGRESLKRGPIEWFVVGATP